MNDDQRKQYLIEFGNRVKELRLEKEMSQDELAKKCGYTSGNARSSIQKIEAGKSNIPASKISLIAKALGVPVSVIMDCWDEMDSSHDTKKLQKEVEQIELDSIVEKKYGTSAFEAISMFVQLDIEEQAEIREKMKQMMKRKKTGT